MDRESRSERKRRAEEEGWEKVENISTLKSNQIGVCEKGVGGEGGGSRDDLLPYSRQNFKQNKKRKSVIFCSV